MTFCSRALALINLARPSACYVALSHERTAAAALPATCTLLTDPRRPHELNGLPTVTILVNAGGRRQSTPKCPSGCADREPVVLQPPARRLYARRAGTAF